MNREMFGWLNNKENVELLIHDIIINYIKDIKNIKLYINIMLIFGIVLLAVNVLLIIFRINIGNISFLLMGISFYIIFIKYIYYNYEFKKSNPHIKETYYPPSRYGLPGYIFLYIGSLYIFFFLLILFWGLFNIVNVRQIE